MPGPNLCRLHFTDTGVNNGLGHGVPGVAVALAAAYRADPSDDQIAAALRHVARRLIDQVYHDQRGIITWSPAGHAGHPPLPRPRRRQAWCYDTPGVAWTLHELSEALAGIGTNEVSAEAGQLARAAMRSVCQYYNELPPRRDTVADRLAICHGAAGVLAIAMLSPHTPTYPTPLYFATGCRATSSIG